MFEVSEGGLSELFRRGAVPWKKRSRNKKEPGTADDSMATRAQKAREQGSYLPTCFHFSGIFSKQKNKKKKKPYEQIDPRVSSAPEYSKDRPQRHRKIWTINWRWFKQIKSVRKQPAVNPRNNQKLERHGIRGKDAERANIPAADRKNYGGSNSGIAHHVSGHPHARQPAVTALQTQTAGDSTAGQIQQEATSRPDRSDQSHQIMNIREIQEEAAVPERQVHVTSCSGDPARSLSSAPNKQMPWKCILSPDFSRNPVNRSGMINKSVSGHGPIIGMSIALVSLTSLLLCGRLCSIFWTSACLCLVSRLRRREITTHEAHVDMDSDEYRKQVIMEGILRMNHKN